VSKPKQLNAGAIVSAYEREARRAERAAKQLRAEDSKASRFKVEPVTTNEAIATWWEDYARKLRGSSANFTTQLQLLDA